MTLWPPTDPLAVLACTAWMEARGDGKDGMQAVASVVLNRVRKSGWWGDDILSVCLRAWQFSCWNVGSTQVPLVQTAMLNGDPEYQIAHNLASLAVQGILPDNTNGADSYYALSMPEPPAWAQASRFRAQIGEQRFYAIEIA
jgi:spore germination cell wall hydrolase CwlJ-like protein